MTETLLVKPALTKTVVLKAPPEKVWAYLTDAKLLASWFHEADVDLAPGRAYQLLSEDASKADRKLCWGRVLEAEKPKRLVYTFTHNHLNGVETQVVWELATCFDGTRLTLSHTGFEAVADPFDMLFGHDGGWDEHIVRLRKAAV